MVKGVDRLTSETLDMYTDELKGKRTAGEKLTKKSGLRRRILINLCTQGALHLHKRLGCLRLMG